MHTHPRRWFSTALLAAVAWLAAAPARAQPVPIARQTCGDYEAVPSGKASNGQPTRLSIQRDGRLLLNVSDWSIGRVECAEIAPGAARTLVVSTYTGGAHCCETVHAWALEPKAPRKILEYQAGNAGGFELRDLNGDGRLELILGDDTFAYFGDLCYACSPSQLPMVACLTEKGFQDCTAQHPAVLRAALDRYRGRLHPPGGDDLKTVEGAALGVLAVSTLLGEIEQGLAAIREAVRSDEVVTWLERARPQVRDWAAARPKRIKDGRQP